MELIHHIHANATFSSLELQSKYKCLKNTAFKQKTFRIVKEHTMREASRDHTSSWFNFLSMSSSHRAAVCTGKAAKQEPADPTGGASRDRTGDLLVANQTLSQLSYGP